MVDNNLNKIVMAWSGCEIQIKEKDQDETQFLSIGAIKSKATTLTAEDGDTLEAAMSGGKLVGYEKLAGSFVLATTVIEPQMVLGLLSIAQYELGTEEDEWDECLTVTTHVVEKEYELKLKPKKKGAWGLYAPRCSVSIQPSWSEETGNEAVLTFGILKDLTKDFWYQKVKNITG